MVKKLTYDELEDHCKDMQAAAIDGVKEIRQLKEENIKLKEQNIHLWKTIESTTKELVEMLKILK